MGQSESKSDHKPKPGDLIEIFRGTYEHWAVYVGDGYVVHLTAPPGDEVPGIISDTLMSVPTEKAMVRKEKLEEAVGDSTWMINNSLDKKYKPCSASIIVKEALMEVGKMMEYSIYSSNCEHFVNELRYGKAVSWQVLEAEQAIAATGVVAVGAVVAVAIAVVAVFIINGKTFSSTSPPV
ncbi:phospholipase A and acyltransferase 4-like [Sparus aurata]|uniref:Phospholipase A and acyltransferase 4-like n=1 Tax=Sparus aurata TaxID=8175 RepID=A0A671WQW8_SPAAU|nr:phospholipase A and acyltransferase 4-like [Sparus aurata]